MEGRVLMPWESKTVEELRREFVLSAQDNINFSALCRKYGITRKTGYKWLKRHAAQMPLSDMSRKPYGKIKKQCGNSVAVPVISAVAKSMIAALKAYEQAKETVD